MTAPLQYGTQPATDPTAVMGRRTLAWIADLLLYGAIIAAGFASMAEYVEIPAGVADEEACELLREQQGDLPACLAADGRAYLLDTDEAGAQTLLSVGYSAFFVILQGVTGGSPGKLLFGLRVVDQYGKRCGIGRSLGRTVMWAIDAAPWLLPLVGPITAFTSTGHRRVGDLAAGTYVVSSSSVGAPVMPGTAPAPAGQHAWGAPPPPGQGWGATTAPPPAPPTSPPSAAAPTPSMFDQPPSRPGDGRWDSGNDADLDLDFRDLDVPAATETADEAPPTVDADPEWSRTPDLAVEPPPAVQDLDRAADADLPEEPEDPTWAAPTLPEVDDPSTGWEPPGDPAADWSPPSGPEGEPAATQPPATPQPAPFAAPGAEPGQAPPEAEAARPEPVRHELPPPQWDTARGTYIQWDPNRQAWLQWDDARQQWKPIDT